MARAEWKQEQPRLDPSKLVFIDETGTSTNMTRLRGRGPRGQRLVAKAVRDWITAVGAKTAYIMPGSP